jgi:hypothetical protein
MGTNEPAISLDGGLGSTLINYILKRLKAGTDPRSPLARTVGSKGYHFRKFAEGPYPAE